MEKVNSTNKVIPLPPSYSKIKGLKTSTSPHHCHQPNPPPPPHLLGSIEAWLETIFAPLRRFTNLSSCFFYRNHASKNSTICSLLFVFSCKTSEIINCLTFEMQRVPGPGSPVPCISFEYNCEVKRTWFKAFKAPTTTLRHLLKDCAVSLLV